jgi:hypothetical protein
MTPAQIQFSHAARLFIHECFDAFEKLSEDEIEEVIEKIDAVTEFLFTVAHRRSRQAK